MTEIARAAIRANRHAALSNKGGFSTLMVIGLLLVVSLCDVCIATEVDFMVISAALGFYYDEFMTHDFCKTLSRELVQQWVRW